MVRREVLFAASRQDAVGSPADALAELRRNRLLKEDAGLVSLYHWELQQFWRASIDEIRRQQLAAAWLAIFDLEDPVQLATPDAAGVIPFVASQLVETESAARIATLGERLIAAGQVGLGLDLLDRVWKYRGGGHSGDTDLLQHALLAARTRLDLGRYGEVAEPLRHAELAAETVPEARAQVLLLHMKLSLRLNEYGPLWHYAERLFKESGLESAKSLEAELILNTAYRDLMELAKLRASCDRLLALRDGWEPDRRNAIDRALARSLTKLGQAALAMHHAETALDSSGELDSVRDVGNSHLAMGEALRYAGSAEAAIGHYRKAAGIGRATGNRDSLIWSMLGEVATHIEARALDKAQGVLVEIDLLVGEPGYVHPLETAHAHLMRMLAGSSSASDDDIGAEYDRLGIAWPRDFLQKFRANGGVGGSIPI